MDFMKILANAKGRSWVAANVNIAEGKSRREVIQTLQARVAAAQVWFFDLDDNHAPSPAKRIAYNQVGTSFFDPRFINWALRSGLPAKLDKGKESQAWEKYVDSFLQSDAAVEEIKRIFDSKSVRKSLYSGVQDFVHHVSDVPGFYVTRNIAEVAGAYASVLALDGVFETADDKGKIVEKYLQEHPSIQMIGVDGDSQEDAEMVEVAKFYRVDVVSFYSMDRPEKSRMNPLFDYAVSKERTTLVKILS